MLTRISKEKAQSLLKNFDYIIDLGCKKDAWRGSNTVLDIDDYTDYYQNQDPPIRFVQGDATSTPFNNKEFDFSIASHLIEHVHDPEKFIKELMRISKRGYIEFPNPIFDNLIRGNETAHKWFVNFDDDSKKLIFTPKVQFINPVFTVRQAGFLNEVFPNSISTSIYWEDSIEYEVRENIHAPKKIAIFWSALGFCAKILRLLRFHKI